MRSELKARPLDFQIATEKVRVLEGVRRGEAAVEEGRTMTQEEAKDRMARWLTHRARAQR
ncbi:MAG: hypothetical protein HOQ01_10985 [Lysobacter sp.]|nr:hypothetical protein [Lysobacter sp.]